MDGQQIGKVALKSLWWIPLLMVAFRMGDMFIPAAITAFRKQMPDVLVFISEGGAFPPQSGIQSICLNMSVIFGFYFIAVRFLVVNRGTPIINKTLHFLNRTSLVVGLIFLIGVIITAGYPLGFTNTSSWFYNVLLWHAVGAYMMLIGTVVYNILQCFITLFQNPIHSPHNKAMFHIRCGLVILQFISALSMMSVTPLVYPLHEITHMNVTESYLRDPKRFDKYYKIGAMSEWIWAVFMLAFFLTYIPEFKRYSLTVIGTKKREK